MLFRSDFVGYVMCDVPVKYITNITRVVSIGTNLQKIINSDIKEVFLPCVSYHIIQTDVLLLSPQTYQHIHGGYYEVYGYRVSMYLTCHQIHITVDREQKNLPIVYNYFMSDNEKRLIGGHIFAAVSHTMLSKLGIFVNLCSINNVQYYGLSVNDTTFKNELDCHSKFCDPCVGYPADQDLTGTHKDLLLWH